MRIVHFYPENTNIRQKELNLLPLAVNRHPITSRAAGHERDSYTDDLQTRTANKQININAYIPICSPYEYVALNTLKLYSNFVYLMRY